MCIYIVSENGLTSWMSEESWNEWLPLILAAVAAVAAATHLDRCSDKGEHASFQSNGLMPQR